LRGLVVALLLANVGFFAWSMWVAEPRQRQPGPPSTAPRLTLGSEAAPVVAEAAAPLQQDVGCVSIGPFLDLTEAAGASTSLRARGLVPRQRAAEGLVWAGFWVALENVASREDAAEIVERLRQSGMGDAYVMPSESDGTTVSLGLFSERARALRRSDEVQALGYRPTITERQRTGTVYWIDIDVRSGAQVPDPASLEGAAGRILRLKLEPCAAAGRASQSVGPELASGGMPG